MWEASSVSLSQEPEAYCQHYYHYHSRAGWDDSITRSREAYKIKTKKRRRNELRSYEAIFYGPISQIWPLLIRFNIASRISWCEVKQDWLISFLVAWCLLLLLNRCRNISQRCCTVEENKESVAVRAISAGTFGWLHTQTAVNENRDFIQNIEQKRGLVSTYNSLLWFTFCIHNRDLVKHDVCVPSMTQINSSARYIDWPNRLKRSFSIILIALWN